MTNREKYIALFKEIFEAKPEELNGCYTVKNVEAWDSMKHIQLMNALEDTFDLMLDSEDIIDFDSYLKGIEILRKYEIEI